MKKRLFASALLTVLLAASGATGAFAHDGGADGKDGKDRKPCHHVQLSDQQKQLLHETMKTVMEKDKALFQKMHDLHKQRHAVLTAETFDAKAFEELSAKIEQTHDKIQKDRVHAFASIAAQFTPEEREEIMRWQKHHHGHKHGHMHGGPMGDKGGDGKPMMWKHGPDGGNNQPWQPREQGMTAPPQDDVTTGTTVNNNDYPPYNKR